MNAPHPRTEYRPEDGSNSGRVDLGKRNIGIAAVTALIAILSLYACNQGSITNASAEGSSETPPDWKRYAWETLHPLMQATQAEQILTKRGYERVKCIDDDPPPEEMADGKVAWGDEAVCFMSPETGVRLSLSAVQWKGARHLSDIYIYEPPAESDEANALALQQRSEELIKIYGAPNAINDNGAVSNYIWAVPGGSKTLPDIVQLTRGKWLAPQIVMTSHWIHKQKVAADAAVNKAE